MNISVNGAQIFWESGFSLPILGEFTITSAITNMWILMAVIIGLFLWLTSGLKVDNISKKQAVVELLVETVTNFVQSNMGIRFSGFIPFISAIFLLSAFCSLSSLVTMYPPTSDLSVVMGWSILVFGLITYYKFKTDGALGYFKGFTKPIFVLTPFNIIGELATPVSMGFRHFGNIASGTIILSLVYAALGLLSSTVLGGIAQLFGGSPDSFFASIPLFQAGIPAIMSLYFDVFSSLLQAFIFCMLTMMFIASAAQTEEE